MTSDLERAVIAAGEAFRASPFGESMRRFHPGRRGGRPEEGFGDPLVMFEVGQAPAIRRTFAVLELLNLSGEKVELDGLQVYLRWVARSARAVQRLAQFCWKPIPVDVRCAVFDQDDLGPAASSYLPASRWDKPGSALFDGLDNPETRGVWQTAAAAARATPCYAAAVEAAERLAEPGLARELHSQRGEISQELRGVADRPIRIHEAFERRHEIVAAGYNEASPLLRGSVTAIRAYNELVNHMLWAVLSIAEETEPLAELSGDLGAIRLRSVGRYADLELALVASGLPWLGHPHTPFVMAAGLPIDGLYLTRGTMLQIAAEEIIDVQGRRLGALESAA